MQISLVIARFCTFSPPAPSKRSTCRQCGARFPLVNYNGPEPTCFPCRQMAAKSAAAQERARKAARVAPYTDAPATAVTPAAASAPPAAADTPPTAAAAAPSAAAPPAAVPSAAPPAAVPPAAVPPAATPSAAAPSAARPPTAVVTRPAVASMPPPPPRPGASRAPPPPVPSAASTAGCVLRDCSSCGEPAFVSPAAAWDAARCTRCAGPAQGELDRVGCECRDEGKRDFCICGGRGQLVRGRGRGRGRGGAPAARGAERGGSSGVGKRAYTCSRCGEPKKGHICSAQSRERPEVVVID